MLRNKALSLVACSMIASFVWVCVFVVTFDIFVPPSDGTQLLMLGAAGLAFVLGLAGFWSGIRQRGSLFLSALGALIGATLLLLTIQSLRE